jgi:hypothetical protein
MRRARFPRRGALILLAGLAGGAGCTHNYYYGTAVPLCPEPETVRVGSVCDVPGQVVPGRTVITQVAPPRSSRVVISEPRGGPLVGGSRLGWRRSDPESLATSSVEGSLDDETLSR